MQIKFFDLLNNKQNTHHKIIITKKVYILTKDFFWFLFLFQLNFLTFSLLTVGFVMVFHTSSQRRSQDFLRGGIFIYLEKLF